MSQIFQRGRIGLAVILVMGITIIAGLWVFKPEPAKRPPAKPLLPVVDVIAAEPQTYLASVVTQGTVAPKRQINLVAEVSGRIVSMSDSFVSGGFFAADEVLVNLDERDYQYALRNAEAQVANAERELALEKGQARQAKRVWRDLGSVEANSLSLREPQVKAAEAALQAARADRQRAALNLQRAAISAPFSGRVESVSVNQGQYVGVGTTLGVVFDRSAVEVRLPLSNEQLALTGIIPGAENVQDLQQKQVTLSASIGGEFYRWPATLQRVEAVVDSRTRLFHVVAEVEAPFDQSVYQHPLVVGLFVEARLSGKQIDNALAIPKKAIINDKVFIVDSNNQLQLRPLTPINSDNKLLWVQADIKRGEKIVVSDPRVLREGLEVTIKQPEKPASAEAQKAISKE